MPDRIQRDPSIDYAIGLMVRAFRAPVGPERDELMADAVRALDHIDDTD